MALTKTTNMPIRTNTPITRNAAELPATIRNTEHTMRRTQREWVAKYRKLSVSSFFLWKKMLIWVVFSPNAGNKIDYDMAIRVALDYLQAAIDTVRHGMMRLPMDPIQVTQVCEFEDSYNVYMEAERKLNEYFAQQASGPVSNTTTGTPIDRSELQALVTSIVREQIAEALQQASDSISIGSSANMSAKEHNQTWPSQQSSAQLGQTSVTIPSDSQFIKPEP